MKKFLLTLVGIICSLGMWADETVFSLTNPTGPTDAVASKNSIDLSATINGGTAILYNGASKSKALVSNSQISLSGSSSSYLKISLSNNSLKVGDVITIDTKNTFKISSTNSNSSVVETDASTGSYTVATGDILVGQSDIYVWKDGGSAFSTLTITRPAAKPYKITFNAGSNGSCSTTDLTESNVGAGVTLPSVTAKTHYTFNGWATTEGAITVDAGVAGDTYKPSTDCTLYAVYKYEYASTVIAKWDVTSPVGTFTYEGGVSNAESFKIHENKDAVKGVKLSSGMISSKALTNYVKVTVEGGFKAGDVVSFSGAYNNTSEKVATIAIATAADNVLCVSGSCINGRLVADDPTIESYTLTSDATDLYIGRDETGNTATYLTSFTVTRPATVVTPTINAKGYGTFSSDCNVLITGAKVYKATLSGTTVTCTEITSGIVPAGTGVLLYKEGVTEGTTATALYVDAAVAITDNDLKATTLADGSLAEKESSLALSHDSNTFKTFTGTAFVAGKAYFPYTSNGASKTFTIVFDGDETTAINAVESIKVNNGTAYNLAGQRVNRDAKGIVIVNGKKYINK